MFQKELSAVAPDLGSWHRVKPHRDCHVKFDHGLYSAPFTLVGQKLWLRANDVAVSIFQDYRLIATHLRCRRSLARSRSLKAVPTLANT